MSAHRKQLKRREIPGHARYLTCSCFHQLALFNNPAIRDAFRAQLAIARERLPFKLLAWVIMPEHFHLLVLPENGLTVRRLLSAIKRPFSTRVLARWDELRAPVLRLITEEDGSRHFWQPGGGYDRNIFTEDERVEKIRYIHLNPVRRGLVNNALDWPWSSFRAYRGLDDAPPRIDKHGFDH